MSRWIKELFALGLLAALAAVVIPRLLIARLPSAVAPLRPSLAPNDPVADAAVADAAPRPQPGEISFDDLAAMAGDPPDAGAGPIAVPPVSDVIPSHHHASGPPATPGGLNGLTRHGSRWTADLSVLPSPRSALSGVRMQPLGDEGAPGEGYRILTRDRLGLFDTVGIRPGDVLVAINGRPVRNPDEALDAYAMLRSERSLSFRFLRNGSSYTVPVDLVGGAHHPP